MAIQHRQSILCPNCKKLISVDEKACPHCGASKPGAWWKRLPLSAHLFKRDQIIRTIIYTNVAMYLISLLISPSSVGWSANPFRFLSPSSKALLVLGSTGTYPIDQWGRWWTLVSANYLHGGVIHILFNMIALRQIGALVVNEYGVNRFIAIYTLGGIAGFLLSYLAGVGLTLGASAAVCSVIGASLYYGKSRGGLYGQLIYKQVGGWVLGLFLFGLVVPGINNWGHGGGLVAGAILGFLLGYQEKTRETAIHRIIAVGCILLTSVILSWATASTFYYRLFS
jgi:rhomboid protease GluP